MDLETREYLDRMFGTTNDRIGGMIARIDQVEASMLEGFAGLGERIEDVIGKLGERMDRLEGRLDRIEPRVSDGFESINDRFHLVDLQLDNVNGGFGLLREQFASFSGLVGGLDRQFGVVGDRLERVQGEVVDVGTRLTGFVNDMRQRFREMSEQLN